jgi:hypothetical protein
LEGVLVTNASEQIADNGVAAGFQAVSRMGILINRRATRFSGSRRPGIYLGHRYDLALHRRREIVFLLRRNAY